MAAAIKGDPRCYNCGKPGHLRKDCLATLKRGKGNNKLPPGDCPRCGKGRHGAKECPSKFNKNGQPIQGNFQGGTRSSAPNPNRSFQNSNQYQGMQGNTVSDLHAATHGSAGLDLVTTNEFILKEQME